MRCIILACGQDLHWTKDKDGLSTHRLPRDLKQRLAWLKALDESDTDYKIVRLSRVCSRHFKDSDFYTVSGKRKLMKDAVPSQHLGPAVGLPPEYIPRQKPKPVMPHSTALAKAMQASVTAGDKRVKTIRYAGDLRDNEVPYVSPEEAQVIVPKIYKQLHRTKLRLSCHKQQNLRLRQKVQQLKDMITDLRNEQGGTKPIFHDQLVTEVKVESTELCEEGYG